MAYDGIRVIVVPDNDAEAYAIPPSILAQLQGNTVIMSNDDLRMYVRASAWEAMKQSFKLTKAK